MTNFEHIKAMSLDELAKWLDTHGQFDSSPWSSWFSETYCDNCETIKCKYVDDNDLLDVTPPYNREIACAFCELENKCRFFPEREDVPDNIATIKMWLLKESNCDCDEKSIKDAKN